MMKRSAGILPYKIEEGVLKIYLEHPGGPFWMNIDKWSICKGEYTSEKAIDAALREFKEETGFELDKEELFYLGSKKQSSNKLVTVFTILVDLDVTKMKSNTFKREWPKGSGVMKEFPEMDEARWFSIEEASEKIFDGQKIFLEKLKLFINNKI